MVNIKRALEVIKSYQKAAKRGANKGYELVYYDDLVNVIKALAEPEEKECEHKPPLTSTYCCCYEAARQCIPCPIHGKPDPIREVYEKYRNREDFLRGLEFFEWQRDMWQAIKHHCQH